MGNLFSVEISGDSVLNRVGSCLCGKDNHILNLEKNLEALEKAIGVLKAKRDDVLIDVQREEAKGQRSLNQVQVWLTSVQTIENQFDDLKNTRTMELQRLCLCGVCSKNLISSFRYGRRVSVMLKDVENLKSDGNFGVVAAEVVVTEQPAMRCVVDEMPLQPVIVGQETMLERAWNRLMDDETGIMGLYGMGGVGKTTLLKQINNKFSEEVDGFQIVIWIVVSSDIQVEKIQDDIAKKLGLRGVEWNWKNKIDKVTDIHAGMKNKKFVLLLDDIWKKVDLTEIGVPFPTRENGCKVVFTTRSMEVCGDMGVDDPMEVQCLTDIEAWDLFEKKVGALTLKSHPRIPEQARKVAEKCCGLPLALNVIGGTMSSKRTIQEWDYAVRVLNSYAADFDGMDEQIFRILEYSFYNLKLKGCQIQSCFLYCALFPEDYLIEKEKLIDYWICEGFIRENEDRETTVNQGYGIIATLVRSCLLLEEGSNISKVKMHDVVRDMAIWISSDRGENREKCIVRAGDGLCEVPKVEKWSAVERMSLMKNKIEEISGSPECPELTTLFLQENSAHISGEFFTCMPKLVVLDLSQNKRLSELPEEISELVSLKYLDLSRTEIWELPVCLWKLKKLIHLYLENMDHLQSIDGISNLPSLRTLRLVPYSKRYRIVESWKELLLLKKLEFLTIDIESKLVLEKLFFSNMGRCFQKVVIKEIWEEPFGNLYFPSILRRLKSPCFLNLSSLAIERCSLKDLTWLVFAPNLIHLSLRELSELEEVLNIEKANEMQAQGIIPFEKLETLVMTYLPAVKSIYWTPLPFLCLREMYIEDCPTLAKLPLDSKSVAEVEMFVIKYDTADWIEGIIWEDEATRLRFLPSRRMVTASCEWTEL